LIVGGLVAIVVAIVLRSSTLEPTTFTATTETEAMGRPPPRAQPIAPSRTVRHGSRHAPFSDSILVALLGLGAVAALAGAFYDRIKDLPTPFGPLPVGPVPQSFGPGPPSTVPAPADQRVPGQPVLEPLQELLGQPALASLNLSEAQARLPNLRPEAVKVAIVGGGLDPRLAEHPVLARRVELPGSRRWRGTPSSLMAGQVSMVLAIAPRARVLPIGALDSQGRTSEQVLAQAIDLALDFEADLMLLDFAYFSADSPERGRALATALATVAEFGRLAIAPAGNAGVPEPTFPASDPHVLGVAASDTHGRLADFSSSGVALAAPGVEIKLLAQAERERLILESRSGTSIAAGIVTGIAALAYGADPDLSPGQLPDLLAQTGDPCETDSDISIVNPLALAAALGRNRS
jgi:hypothetical protein